MATFEGSPEVITPPNFGITIEQPAAALELIDNFIRDVYLPFRGAKGFKTERAILLGRSHAKHRENDAEHSWHVTETGQVLVDNQETIGLVLPEDFSEDEMREFGNVHDLIEIWSGDVDALSLDKELVKNKHAREMAMAAEVEFRYPYLRRRIAAWRRYERKDTPASHFIKDIDNINGTRMIALDGGKRWQNWEGQSSTRDEMLTVCRAKLLTDFGRLVYKEIEKDFDEHPEYFAPKRRGILSLAGLRYTIGK